MQAHCRRKSVGTGFVGAGLAFGLAFGLALGSPVTVAAQDPVPETPAADGPTRIAVVNIDFVAAQSPAGRELQQQIQELREQYSAELQRRQEEARTIEQRVAQADTLTDDERRSLEREYQDAVTAFQRYQQDVQERAQRMQSEGMAEIREQIEPVLEAVMREQGFDLVLNSSNAAIVFASDRIDITQTVLDRLRAEAPGGG